MGFRKKSNLNWSEHSSDQELRGEGVCLVMVIRYPKNDESESKGGKQDNSKSFAFFASKHADSIVTD